MESPWGYPSGMELLDRAIDSDGKKLLDIGCGAGELVRHLITRGADAIGIECSPEMLRRAHLADPQNTHRYVDGVAQDMPVGDAAFDAVVFHYSLHHVPVESMRAALSETARVLRPGGRLYAIEPIATGLGHEVDVLVDDETEVRAHAQHALDTALVGFDADEPLRWTSTWSYRNFTDYAELLVGVDNTRSSMLAERRSEVEELFYKNAVEHNGRWWFEDFVLARTFTRHSADR